MVGFRRSQGKYAIHLSAAEVRLLADVVDQVRDLLAIRRAQTPDDPLQAITGMHGSPETTPEDPALARLLPDFVRPTPGLAAEAAAELASGLRVLHEPELIRSKDHAAVLLLNSLPVGGGTVRLSPEVADAWLTALNDVRLALGVRLRIDDDDTLPDLTHPDLGDSGEMLFSVYRWLSALQDSLVSTMLD